MIQCVVQRPRLGFHAAVWHHDHPHPGRQIASAQCIAGHLVFLFDHQQDIQQFAWIFQPIQPCGQFCGDVAFAVKRHHHRNHGQMRDHCGVARL